MGGNALSKPSDRLTKEEYFALAENIISTLEKSRKGLKLAVVKAFHNKDSFGDIDILVSNNGNAYDPYAIAACLNAVEIVRNGDVTSIGVEAFSKFFQIDFIKVPLECFDFAQGYFSYNDLGNFIGRIAHKMGFKFGHKGLYYVARSPTDDTHLLEEILITTDHLKALDFLEYFSEEYVKGDKDGFKTLENVFDYAMSNPYFNPAIYLFENLNHTNRIRDRKRASYNKFLAYIEDKITDREYFDWDSNKEETRKIFLEKAFEDTILKKYL